MPETLAELDGLLLTVPKHRTGQRGGLHLQGQRYLSPTLAPFVGYPVTIHYDPRDTPHVESALSCWLLDLRQAQVFRTRRALSPTPNLVSSRAG